LYTVFRYKKEYLDPLKSKSVSPNVVTTSKTTLKPYTSQKPSLHRIGHLKENFANKSNHSQSDELHPLIVENFIKVLKKLNAQIMFEEPKGLIKTN